MKFLCNQCAPENTDAFRVGARITGVCENDSCEQFDYPVDQTPVRGYALRESCGGEG